MTKLLKLTRLPLLNDAIVIRQSGGHYFIAAPDSIIIDKAGLLRLIEELCRVQYITLTNMREMIDRLIQEEEDGSNKENSSNLSVR